MVITQTTPTGTNASRMSPPSKRHNGRFIKGCKVYGGSLVRTSIAFPIVDSAITVCIYLTPSAKTMSSWSVLAYGFLTTCIALLVFAAFRYHFATARGANAYVYGLLERHHTELQARLGEPDDLTQNDDDDENTTLEEISKRFNISHNDGQNYEYKMLELRKAYKEYKDLHQSLFHTNTGLAWVFGTGYVNAWRMVHRAQEALVGIETREEVIGDVIHDVKTIQSSARNSQEDDTSIRQLIKAVKVLLPDALLNYFPDLASDPKFASLFKEKSLDQCSLPDIMHQTIAQGKGSPNKKPSGQLATLHQVVQQVKHSFDKKSPDPTDQTNSDKIEQETMARQVVQQVKHSFNRYQDNLRSELIRARNYLSASIAFTGVVTHLLLCIVILLENSPGSNKSALIATTAYYMIGAITGLFGRFYNEANSNNAPDDYGLFLSRLLATPLLSGLAAIGGVIITSTLGIGTQGIEQNTLTLGKLFDGTLTLDHLVAAAVFGFAPNLILASFQQRTQKYATDLQNSKGEGNSKGD